MVRFIECVFYRYVMDDVNILVVGIGGYYWYGLV